MDAKRWIQEIANMGLDQLGELHVALSRLEEWPTFKKEYFGTRIFDLKYFIEKRLELPNKRAFLDKEVSCEEAKEAFMKLVRIRKDYNLETIFHFISDTLVAYELDDLADRLVDLRREYESRKDEVNLHFVDVDYDEDEDR